MEDLKTARKWSELYKLNVTIPSEGKTVGNVEDFYLQEGTNEIYALSVRTRLHGDLSLPVTGIKSIDADHVAIPSMEMLMKAIPPFIHGNTLLSRTVVSEKGNELGAVSDVVLGTYPPTALRVSAFEMTRGDAKRKHSFPSEGVARYEDNTVVVYDHTAKKMR